MQQPGSSAVGVRWDLSDLFAAPTDPRIDETLDSTKTAADDFAAHYRGTVNVAGGPTPSHLKTALDRLADLNDGLSRVAYYAHLIYDTDTRNTEYRGLLQKVEQRLTELRNILLFFDLEWLELPDDVADRIANAPELAEYRHYLLAERRYRPHKLSEPEEKIVNEKDVSGRSAWARLFTETTSALVFPIERDGETRDSTLSEVLALFHEPDRALRQRAHDTLYDVLSKNGALLTFTYDTLVQDYLTMDRLRHYDDPMQRRHLANEVDAESVNRMMEVTEQNYGIAQDYFRLKARLVNLPKLVIYDQYAPIQAEKASCTYAESKEIVLGALDRFIPRFREVATQFFEKNWIDAEPRPGKRGGAYCASPSPALHPYILCNYTDNLRDAMTVAHEMGHGLHGYLSRGQNVFNYHPSLPLAETASVFAEMLVFEDLVERAPSPSAQLGLICGKIEDIFATVYRQNVLTRFEQAVYAQRGQGRLTTDQVQDAWIAANGLYYGDAVQMTEEYRWGWSYIPHFINTPFYCYSYVFGELLVLALYAMYKEQGAPFVPKYVKLLESGSSAAPAELLAPLGANFRDPGFWQKGFDELRTLVERANTLASAQSTASAGT